MEALNKHIDWLKKELAYAKRSAQAQIKPKGPHSEHYWYWFDQYCLLDRCLVHALSLEIVGCTDCHKSRDFCQEHV